MAKLTVKRSSEWINKLRDIGVYVDGKKLGTIQDGETKSFEVEAGKHLVSSKIDWCGSNKEDVDIDETEPVHIRLSSFKYSGRVMFLALFLIIMITSVPFFLEWDMEQAWLLSIPIVLYLVYYLTLGRNRYLRMERMETTKE